jgi:hypothetical protein
MKPEFRENKQSIRSFMQNHYTDSRLAELLCHARDGKLSYSSCCCFIGIATAAHALQTAWPASAFGPTSERHYIAAKELPGARLAEYAFYHLCGGNAFNDEYRRRILIPMVRAEMRRRERVRAIAQVQELVAEAV